MVRPSPASQRHGLDCAAVASVRRQGLGRAARQLVGANPLGPRRGRPSLGAHRDQVDPGTGLEAPGLDGAAVARLRRQGFGTVGLQADRDPRRTAAPGGRKDDQGPTNPEKADSHIQSYFYCKGYYSRRTY